MTVPINNVKTALTARLAGDATLTALVGGTAIFDSMAPEGTTGSYVVFQKLAGTPTYTLGQRAFDTQQFMVKGVTQGSSKALGGSIAQRIDTLLDDAPLTITGATNLYLRRAADIDYPEVDRGDTFHHIGATYSVWVS